MKRTARLVDWLSVLAVGWLVAAMLPLSTLWFDPGLVVIQDTPRGISPPLAFSREIKRDVKMRYSVVVRDADLSAVCESRSEIIRYRADATLPEGIDLDWWTAGDCVTLEPGLYVVETCWTATQRWWGILPERSVCVLSNPFKVT